MAQVILRYRPYLHKTKYYALFLHLSLNAAATASQVHGAIRPYLGSKGRRRDGGSRGTREYALTDGARRGE